MNFKEFLLEFKTTTPSTLWRPGVVMRSQYEHHICVEVCEWIEKIMNSGVIQFAFRAGGRYKSRIDKLYECLLDFLTKRPCYPDAPFENNEKYIEKIDFFLKWARRVVCNMHNANIPGKRAFEIDSDKGQKLLKLHDILCQIT